MYRKYHIGASMVLALAVLVAIGLWKTSGGSGPAKRIALVHHPRGVMGTVCTLGAVVKPADESPGRRALAEAEATLREVETRMSFWLHDSEISRLNAAEADVDIPLSPRTLDVLHAARKASMATSGAFDVTCRPLLDLWKQAGKRGQKPSEAELAEARSSVGWRHIELTPQGAVKHQREARLDLGGIAKGYAVDRAVEALQHAGLVGGIVDVGGDLRCFGDSTDGSEWAGEIRNPFGEGSLARLRFRDRGVCSSGNYARFTEIEGHRYSHIVDPRSGWPADAVPSVTVIAATALEADIWATALSVLGEAGLDLLPGGVDALLVVGTRQSHRMLVTVGFRRWLSGPLTEGVTYHEAKPSEPRSGDGHTP